MKKIICIMLCLLMITAAFAGCVNKPKTFEEAAEAGKAFIKGDALKDIKYVTEADGTKLILEGKYDPKNEKAVFSVSLDFKDTVHTFKELIKLDGKKLYVKIPDMSGLEDVFGGSLPFGSASLPDYEVYDDNSYEELIEGVEGLGDVFEGVEGSDDFDGLEELGAFSGTDLMTDLYGNSGMPDDLTGKYIMIKLPENKPETIKGIITDAEDAVFEKAEKLDPEENYPYVVKYTQKNAYDLIISVLDGIKAKKKELSAEASAIIAEYLGEENFKAVEEVSGKPIADLISEGIDEFFKQITPEDIAPEDAEKFDVIQKIAYDTDKKLEYVFLYDLKDGEETHSIKTTLTVTASEEDAGLAEKCAVSEEEIFDVVGYLQNLLKMMKTLSGIGLY